MLNFRGSVAAKVQVMRRMDGWMPGNRSALERHAFILVVVCSESMAHEFDLCFISGDQSLRRLRVIRRMDGWVLGNRRA